MDRHLGDGSHVLGDDSHVFHLLVRDWVHSHGSLDVGHTNLYTYPGTVNPKVDNVMLVLGNNSYIVASATLNEKNAKSSFVK